MTKSIWAARIPTAFVTLVLVGSALTKLAGVSKVVGELTHAGIPAGAVAAIGLLELTCLALYLFPRTAVLGMFLLTGYLGGAVLTHIVSHQSILPPLMIGLMSWVGGYFRIPELQNLLPLIKTGESGARYRGAGQAQPAVSRG